MMRLMILRIPMMLVELGVTAIILVVCVLRLSTTTSWLSDITRHGDYFAWVLVLDVLVAVFLAARVEHTRWVRNVSIAFHASLVLLFIGAFVVWHLGIFPD